MEKTKKLQTEVFEDTINKGNKKDSGSRLFFVFFIFYVGIFVCFVAMFLSFKFTFTCVPVIGVSMKNTINSSLNDTETETSCDWVYIREKANYDRGDIIVFYAKYKDSNGQDLSLIKRLIALENDAVTIAQDKDDGLYYVYRVKGDALVDGIIQEHEIEKLDEPYIKSRTEWKLIYNDTYGIYGWDYQKEFFKTFFFSGNYEVIKCEENQMQFAIIPEGEFFYLGDNRGHSTDARENGTDYLASIKGSAEIIVKDAANSGSTLLLQIRDVFSYYGREIGNFFTKLWNDMLEYFAI